MKQDGAAHHPGAALSSLKALESALAVAPEGQPGVRIYGSAPLCEILTDGPIAAIARQYLGAAARPVRAILFDKSAATNWALGWHQDRTIAVQTRHTTAGFGPWSIKAGVQHVEPPFAVIASMVTLRIHLDDVPADNAPLLIACGSHRRGKIADIDAETIARQHESATCLAARGDVWAYATPILHASARSSGNRRRRVLQVDVSDAALPAPLAWLGI